VPALSYASVNGGLLILSLGSQVIAIDTLHGASDGAPGRVLWTQELHEQIGGYPVNQALMSRPVQVAWGGTRYIPQDGAGRRMGSIGPVNDDGVYFQRLHDLHCVDPITGKIIWTRKNVGAGNDLFGDAELLFVVPPDSGETLVLRAATGELLGKRRLPPFEKRMTSVGRHVLVWDRQLPNGQQTLEMRDPWQEKTLWSYPFPPEAKAALVGQEAVGVFQPNGQFSLITLADGKELVKEKLEAELRLLGMYLLRSNEGYLLVTNATARNEANRTVQPVPNVPNSLISGHIYAFERGTGKKLWPAPVAVTQQGLLMSQPSELPFLVFARQVHSLVPPNSQNPKVGVVCVDKRTGRVVYENDALPTATFGNYEVTGDPAAHTVTLTLAPKQFTFTLTDDAIGDPQAAADRRSQPSKRGNDAQLAKGTP